MNFQGALQAERKYNTSMSVCDQLELLSDSRTDLVHFNLPKRATMLKRTFMINCRWNTTSIPHCFI